MSSDEIVWQVINNQFCAFKLRSSKDRNFCRNEYNVTGLCNRQSCPLANSRYATVRAHPNKGTIYLYIKTVERAHMPSKLWQRIKLAQNYQQALKQIDDQLIYWPKYLIHKCKQRLTRHIQVAIRMRRLEKEEARLGEKLAPKLAPKVKHREAARERKAEAAAKLERVIERELIERLRSGVYGGQPLNVSEEIWKKVLRAMENEGEGVRDEDLDEGIEEDEVEEENQFELEEDEEGEEGNIEYVSDFDESEDELADIEDWQGTSDEELDEGSEPDTEDSDIDSGDEVKNQKPVSAKLLKDVAGSKRKRPDVDDSDDNFKPMSSLKKPTKGRVGKNKKASRRISEMEQEHEVEEAVQFV